MSQERDFKGVWIPKEIWLNEELTLLEKIIFVEIDSLDNEDHCIAGNEYFAAFCNCSESKVSKAIKKLKELDMIEELSFDGRHRKIRVIKNTNQSSKKYEADSQNLQSNNIDNSTNNKKNNSKELLQKSNFEFGKQKTNKQNLYTKCVSLIDSYDFADLRNLLIDYLNYRLSMKDKPLYANMWKGMLNKLAEMNNQKAVIQQSLERGYLSFYPVSNGSYAKDYDVRKGKSWEEGLSCEQYTEEELAELDALEKEREAKGMRTRF